MADADADADDGSDAVTAMVAHWGWLVLYVLVLLVVAVSGFVGAVMVFSGLLWVGVWLLDWMFMAARALL